VKKVTKAIIAIVLVAILAYASLAIYSVYIQNNGGNSCTPYLRTDCGGDHNIITYNTSNGDITIPSVSQSLGTTWYNVAIAYVPGNPNLEPTAAYFTADSSDFSGNMLASGQTVTIHNLNATGPATSGQIYNGSLWIAYTSSSGGPDCAGAYQAVSGCQYAQIGTITLTG
jgi:hypothetical protein